MYVGIDLSKCTIACTLLETPDKLRFFGNTLENTAQGFNELLTLIARHTNPKTCVFVTENTGVYGERLYYFLHGKGYQVTMEPAHYIRRAFRLKKKTDPVDSRMIAEYGYRYHDQLHIWSPPPRVVEQVRILLVNYSLIQKEKTAHRNILKALDNKVLQDFVHMHQDAIDLFKQQKKSLDKAIRETLRENPAIAQQSTNLSTIPGVGPIFCANFLVITEGYRYVDYRNLAGYLGICPNPYESGKTVWRRPKSDKKGPKRMRKQLYLSAMSTLKDPDGDMQRYFQRLEAKGKPSRLIMNNIANKLLRTACAVILSGRPYDPKYKSVRFF